MKELSENRLIFRIALHAQTEHEAKRLLNSIAGLFDEEEYFVVRVEPKANKNPNVSLETFAMVIVYERDVVE